MPAAPGEPQAHPEAALDQEPLPGPARGLLPALRLTLLAAPKKTC